MASKKKILLIEDSEEEASIIKLYAEFFKYKIIVEVDGVNGYKTFLKEKPDVVILDIMLPGKNGFDICKKAKNVTSLKNIPIIILTAKSNELDEVLALELGAADFVSKPFSAKVLFARIKNVLKTKKNTTKSLKFLSFGDFILDVEEYILKKEKKPIPLTLSEFGILKRLLINKGKVLSREQLLEDLDSEDSLVITRNVDVHIASLRKKIKDEINWIKTVRGIGYRFLNKKS